MGYGTRYTGNMISVKANNDFLICFYEQGLYIYIYLGMHKEIQFRLKAGN